MLRNQTLKNIQKKIYTKFDPKIVANDVHFENVPSFKYLGHIITADVDPVAPVKTRVQIAQQTL